MTLIGMNGNRFGLEQDPEKRRQKIQQFFKSGGPDLMDSVISCRLSNAYNHYLK